MFRGNNRIQAYILVSRRQLVFT